jgi:heat-inducible transcriptional repressor
VSERRDRHDGLDAREEAILRSVIGQHLLTGEPIGSRTVSRGRRLDLSPATIRAIMSELEARGFLSQPHTSAGRVPTAKAWRVWVDRMMARPRIDPAHARAIDEALSGRRSEITDLLGEASRQLSRFSHHVGVVLAPDLDRIVVEHIEFVRLDGRRLVAILVGRAGVVHNRILTIDEPLGQDELDRIGRYLTDEFSGRTLPEIRELLRDKVREERAAYDRLVAHGLDLGRRAVDAERGATGVFVDGTANLLSSPEFADIEKGKLLLTALERRQTLIDLLGRVLEGGGVQVVIGDEQPSADLADCSLVAATYGTPNRVMGTLGVVGPKRMEYAQAIALVDHLAAVLNRFFSREN